MLIDDVIQSVSGDIGPKLGDYGIPAEKTSDVFSLANSTMVDEFKSRADSGSLDDLLGLFNGAQDINSSPLVNNLSSGFASKLASQFNISPEMAKSAASMILPALLSKLNDSTPDSGLSTDMLSSIVGGDNLMGKIKGLFS
jgi:hypothetical protein